MLKNYFKIAFRNLWRHKIFSFINIMGLTVGMTAFFLIYLYVSFELSYDSFHKKSDRIYRVVCDIKTPTEVLNADLPAWAVPSHLKNEFPEIESFARVNGESFLIRRGDIKFQEEEAAWADSSLFHVFDFKLIKGDPKTALKEPFSIVFTESTAKKYFGKEEPVGKTVLITGEAHPTLVTGIIKDFPENSQIKATALVSMSTLTEKMAPNLEKQWANFGATTFLLLKPKASIKTLESKIPAFFEKFAGKEMRDNKMYFSLIFEPLRDVYLYTTRGGNKSGNINNVYTFSIIAIFILLIACINFINLTTARSAERAKEVGIRKAVGALRSQLTSQFIGESVLLCLMAFVVTLVLSALLLPTFNLLSGKAISTGIFSNLSAPFLLLVASIAIGLLAGIYPALVLSSFKPVTVLKGRFITGTKGILLRKGLVIVQFTVSIVLIIGTIVVYNQMNFMRSRELGFSKDQILVTNSFGEAGKDAFKQAVLEIPAVESATTSSAIPSGGMNIAYSQVENNHGDMQIANLNLFFVDHDYTNLFKIKIVAGRSFSRDFGTDTTQAMVLNETAVKSLGYSSPQQIIGKKFSQWGREGKVIGVMKDFHYRSLQEIIKPLSMRIEPRGCDLVSIKLATKNLPGTIASIEKKWKELIPNRPFSYFFLDENFDKQYRAEERFGKLVFNFSILAILISCLGLLGLAYYSTIQRTKEIGVRKVMGASVGNIVTLLSKDFLKLVLIAFVIASPLAWYVMNKWLEDFAYRISIAWWVFLLAGFTAIVIALLTVSYQAFKAAVANPVKSLRTE